MQVLDQNCKIHRKKNELSLCVFIIVDFLFVDFLEVSLRWLLQICGLFANSCANNCCNCAGGTPLAGLPPTCPPASMMAMLKLLLHYLRFSRNKQTTSAQIGLFYYNEHKPLFARSTIIMKIHEHQLCIQFCFFTFFWSFSSSNK